MGPNPKPKITIPRGLSGRLPVAAKVWSFKAENIVRSGVFAVNVFGALQAISTARKMKGDAGAVLTVAEKWRAAAGKINDCEKPLFMSYDSLTADWSGSAYTAYEKLMTRNSTVATGNAIALLAAETALLDLSIQVTNAYNSAVDLMTLAASKIQPALGSVGLTHTKADDKPTIAKALGEFVAAINEQDTKLRAAVNNQKVGLAKLANALTSLKSPAEVPSNVEDPHHWTYQ